MENNDAAQTPLLRVEELKAGYRVYEGFLAVLGGVNLTINPGERIGLVGEAGNESGFEEPHFKLPQPFSSRPMAIIRAIGAGVSFMRASGVGFSRGIWGFGRFGNLSINRPERLMAGFQPDVK